jgi:hypothetical protein
LDIFSVKWKISNRQSQEFLHPGVNKKNKALMKPYATKKRSGG